MPNDVQATRTRADFPWLTRCVSGFTITPRLPDELFDTVVNFCDPHTLATLARCNTEVHAVAIPALYRTVVLTKKTLDSLTKTKTAFHPQNRWFQYTVECCRLATDALVVGDILGATISGLLSHCSAEHDKVRVLFPNVSNLSLEDVPIQSLHECVWLFQPAHLCWRLIPSLEAEAFDLDEELVYGDKPGNERYKQFRLSVESLTIHANDKVRLPCFAFQNLKLRVFRRSTTRHIRLVLPSRSVQPRTLSLPRSIEVVGSGRPSNTRYTRRENEKRVKNWLSFCDSIVGTVLDEDRDFMSRIIVTSIRDAAPCTVCGTL